MTTLVPYRCEHANGDVKFAVRPSDIAVLGASSYVCVIDPAAQFDTIRIGPVYGDSVPTFTYTSNTVHDIADTLPQAESPIVISGRGGNTPATVAVHVTITHTWVWDLVVTLVSPTNNLYVLHNHVSNDGTESGGDANLNSDYSVSVTSEPIDGTWTLRVLDDVGGDFGTLDSWSITP